MKRKCCCDHGATADARLIVARHFPEKTVILDITLSRPGRKGLLGIGARFPLYRASVLKPSTARIDYRPQVKVEIEFLTREEAAARDEKLKQKQLRETCCVCGKTLESIGADIRAMQQRGVTVITHDLIAFCELCAVTFCSNHYNYNEMAGTHTCRKCGNNLKVTRIGYLTNRGTE